VNGDDKNNGIIHVPSDTPVLSNTTNILCSSGGETFFCEIQDCGPLKDKVKKVQSPNPTYSPVIDTSFDPLQFSLDDAFQAQIKTKSIVYTQKG
jgi:hypothetical protein